MPGLEPATTPGIEEGVDPSEVGSGKKASRAEAKARKAFNKLGLIQVAGVSRAVVRKGKQVYFVVNQPDVFKSSTNDNTFVFFGEAKVGGDDQASQLAALQQQINASKAAGGAAEGDDEIPPLVETKAAETTETVDDSGVNPKHIELVLEQVGGATRAQAVAALKKTNGDVVNAIMELSMSS